MADKTKNPAVVEDEEILDFSGVTPFEPLDSGVIYLCKVSNLDKGTSKDGTRKTSNAELEIVGPEEVNAEVWEPNDEGDLVFVGKSDKKIKAAGRKLFRTFTLEPQALPFLYNFLKALDPDVNLGGKDDDGNIIPFRYRPAEWIGMQLAVKGDNEAYQEQVRLRPNKVYPADRYKG